MVFLLFPPLLLPVTAAAQLDLDLQMEHYVAFRCFDADSLDVGLCNGAEGDTAVDGLNLPGEWLEVSFSLDESFCFRSTLVSQRTEEHHSRWALLFSLEGAEVPARVDSMYTIVGEGIGCYAPYHWTESDAAGCLEPGLYRLRLELQTKGMNRVDCIHLTEAESPVRSTTWGRIKARYGAP
jgi:hypothetical protein